ncbi:alpha/beta fold hydrolase [Nocardioides sp. zg-1230]|uniref:alpha/beta fold hydrolase n=1 Tax=Nocardioides sp. zg-1230 TaxID=2736601 RepID=UPI0015554FB9|nr:alpha/beta hydrolase [Nocardioides sp. zg-1230]NPC41706.1 alpha/beta hydrolase [Nocardioides sp. zg-1230]
MRHLSHPRNRRTVPLTGACLVLAAVVASCAERSEAGAEPAPSSTSSAPAQASSAPGTETAPVPITSDVYDVGGHKLYMTCSGGGPITVVFVHGWVNDPGFVPHEHITGVADRLVDDYRVCAYDRRNVGSSETVDAVQTPADVVQDMERVLAAGGVEPPYILLAGSFGGLVATAYLEKHPDDVVGMALVDTMFPDELRLDPFLPREFRFLYFDKDDKCCTVERISQYALIRSLQKGIGEEPDIPVVYLASEQEPRDQNNFESPKYDARILDAQAAYVDRFAPGVLRWVDAPHWMEPVVPDVVADAVREVDALRDQ